MKIRACFFILYVFKNNENRENIKNKFDFFSLKNIEK